MLSTTGGSVPGGRRRRSAIARLAMLLSAAFGSVPGTKINLDQAHPGEGSRFDVVNIAAEREKALKRIW